MAKYAISVVRAPDSKILDFFDRLAKERNFQQCRVQIMGADGELGLDHPLLEKIRTQNAYSLSVAQANKERAHVIYHRNVDTNKFAKPDQVQFTNNDNAVDIEGALLIDSLISEFFLSTTPAESELLWDGTAFTSVIASHQEIITRLEQSLEAGNSPRNA